MWGVGSKAIGLCSPLECPLGRAMAAFVNFEAYHWGGGAEPTVGAIHMSQG